MKENKIIGICCLIISVICLIGAYYFKVFEHEFLWNLALGIATGAILSMVIAIITFFLQKKERITELKADIKEEIEKYTRILDSFEYIYFEDKLEEEIKELEFNKVNETWKNSFIESNKQLEKINKKKLICLGQLNIEYLSKKIEELSKLDKKIEFDRFELTKNKIKEVKQNTVFMNFDKIHEERHYKNIQNIMFECRDDDGKKIDKDIKIENGDIYPTNIENVILEGLEDIEIKMI